MTEAQYMANVLDVWGDTSYGVEQVEFYNAAQMLRDQHNEIVQLKAKVAELTNDIKELIKNPPSPC